MNELEQLANEIIESAPEELRERLRQVYVGGQQTGMAIINAIQAWAESEEAQDLIRQEMDETAQPDGTVSDADS